MNWNLSTDFIALGSGVAGSSAAVAAADAGMEAMILEKTPLLGGSSCYSYGLLWIPNNHLQRRHGIADSTDAGKQYMTYLGAGRQFPGHVDAFLDNAPQVAEYFERVGDVRLHMVDGVADHYYPHAPCSMDFGRVLQVDPFPAQTLGEWQDRLRHSPYIERITFDEMVKWGGRVNEKNWDQALIMQREADDYRTFGAGLAGYFIRAALNKGVRIMTEAEADRLIVDDGEVKGVEVKKDGEVLRIQARQGVLIGTGLYGGNPRLVTWWDDYPPHPTQRPPLSSQGDGFVIAMEHGAAIHIQHGTLANHLARPLWKEEDGFPIGRQADLREVEAAHSLLVNLDGNRFADESFFEHVAIKLREFDIWRHRYINRPCFLIFDQQFWDKYGLTPIEPGGEIPVGIPRANSLEELAAKTGINAENLVNSVRRFNELAETGQDLDFHRGQTSWGRRVAGDLKGQKNPNMGPVTNPPFCALELFSADSRSAGLVTNEQGQVIHVRGHAIPGLYACGEVSAQLHVGIGYQAGYTLTGAMTFGYLAVQHAKSRRSQ